MLKACILGLAAGDALGVPVEFRSREDLDADPVTGLREYGTYPVPQGSWSDDTSMALCALDALSEPDFRWEQVMNNFALWFYEGKYTPTGVCFDAGDICARAISAFKAGTPPEACGQSGEKDNGNGSLMRVLPFALYAPQDLNFVEQASALTHAHPRSRMACGIFTLIIDEILTAGGKNSVRRGIEKARGYYGGEEEWLYFEPLLHIEERSRESIVSSGYVVATLEAAVWCLLTTESYEECVLKAVNLGRDTDTVAAVAGGAAGALYGPDAVPGEWLAALGKRKQIETLCEKAWERWNRGGNGGENC